MQKRIIYSKHYESVVVRDRMESLPFERSIKYHEYIRDACCFADRWGVDVEIIEGEHRLAGFSNAVEFPRRKSRPCNVEMILIWEEEKY